MTTIKSEFYGTGQYWYFDNGQYGEKTEEKRRDCYSILYGDNGEIFGLNYWQENENRQRLNSGLYSVNGLSGKKLEIYNELVLEDIDITHTREDQK